MKITFLDVKTVGNLPEIDLLKTFGELQLFPVTKPSETWKRIRDSQVVITNKVVIDRKMMNKCPELRLICVAATGTNNIDLEAAKEKGIEVRNVKGYSTDSVAQHTFAMIFHLLNHLSFYDKYVKSKKYSAGPIFTSLDRPVFELKGKRLGIIGLGAIGQRVAGIAALFGAEVVYFSTTGRHDDPVYARVPLEELLKTCDLISIHAPLTEQTKGLISMAQLKMMKKEAMLVNTGRGGIVNEKDLAKALNQSLIRAAAFDVFEKEPLPKGHPFLTVKDRERLLLTPHIAWSSVEARRELLKGVYQNIADFINR